MSQSKSGILAARIYIVLALVVGICTLPLVFTAGMGALFGLAVLFAGLNWVGFIFLVWPLAGLLGYLAWLRLTMLVSFDGTHNLQAARGYWWLFLLLGVVAVLPLTVGLFSSKKYSIGIGHVFSHAVSIGLPVLAGYLVFLRLRGNSAGEKDQR
ncbi:MAG: hypothetical protein LBE81_01730 [Azonexus sp.]|uniref:hypothetical protein n=1 Tax=Azonexus sp. TaxID=1872668 RepID=UPI00282BB8B2|nr:hypothetical protein [Azonexus sp.]MDR0775346.1 hypothetical protein [Azonexus sp.]